MATLRLNHIGLICLAETDREDEKRERRVVNTGKDAQAQLMKKRLQWDSIRKAVSPSAGKRLKVAYPLNIYSSIHSSIHPEKHLSLQVSYNNQLLSGQDPSENGQRRVIFFSEHVELEMVDFYFI